MVTDPPTSRSSRRNKGVDIVGLGLLVMALGAFEMVLDKGQEDDWSTRPSSSGRRSSRWSRR